MKRAFFSVVFGLFLLLSSAVALADRPALYYGSINCPVLGAPPPGIFGVFGSCSAADSAAFSLIQSGCDPIGKGFTPCGSGCNSLNQGSTIDYSSNSQAGCGSWGGATSFCPDPSAVGYLFAGRVWCQTVDHDTERNIGECKTCEGNPIFPGIGNKYEVATDYVGAGPFPLKFTRVYNSRDPGFGLVTSRIGGRWVHNYGMRIVYDQSQPSPDFIRAIRADGKMIPFLGPTLNAPQDPTVSERLEVLPSGFKLTTQNDEVELYALNGKLLSITNREGLTQTLTYDANGNLTTVTDPFGRTLTFTYEPSHGWIQTITLPDNSSTIQYTYASHDVVNTLVGVTYPDGTSRGYLMSPPRGFTPPQNILIGIVDEKGVQYATFDYFFGSPEVWVNSTEHAGGVGKVVLQDLGRGNGPRGIHVTRYITPTTFVTRLYTYNPAGELTVLGGVSGAPCPSCGNPASTYDSNANLASTTDWNGNRTNYTYDLSRNLETSRTEGLTSSGATTPQTRTISTQWDLVFRLPTLIAEPLRMTTNVYDPDGTQCGARGKLCSKTIQPTNDASGSLAFSATPAGTPRVWSYTYNSNGQVLTANGPRTDVADVTTYTYYPNNDDQTRAGNLATVTNALGHVTQITAYNAHGQPLTTIDANGMTTTMTYDLRQRLTSRTAGGETTSYSYDPAGQLTQVTLPDNSFLSYTYDDAHRLVAMQDNLGNRIVYTLDLMGNRTAEQVFDPGNNLAQTRTRVYSEINRLFQEIGSTGQTTQYAYDNQGNVTSVTDPLNHTTANAYDALNRVRQVTDPALGITQYAYNGLSALTQVTDPRTLATSYTLDGLGNLNQQVSPDTGTTSNTYDAAGNLLFQTDAKGQVTSYVYDPLNRVTSITFNDGSKQLYTYDAGTNSLGRLSSITERNPADQITSVIAYTYEQHGRVTSEARTIAGVQYVLGYGYDAAGRLSGLTYPSGRTIAYGFDAAGRVNSVNTTKSGQTQSVVSNVTYHPFGGVNGFTLGNGQVYSRPRDTDGRVASYTVGPQTFAIAYDAASRISVISDAANPSNMNGYGYDALDRLTQALLPSTSYNYAYDAVGNRTSKASGASTDTYTYSASSNQIASLTPATGPTRTFSFDANGSTINDGLNAYIYDTRGRMVQSVSVVGTTAYQINALGQRVRKTNSSDDRIFHYDTRGKLIGESDPGGTTWKREYIYLGDIPVGVVQ
jgi:YD repeat-containing protein